MGAARKEDVYYIDVLGKALQVLDAFAQSLKPALTLHEVSAITSLSKNSVFRLLYTLGEHGYVVKRGYEYELGAHTAELGRAKSRQRDLLTVAGPEMDRLRDRFGETVNLGVLGDAQIRYVDVRESPQRFRMAERVGGSDLLHCTALGKATLAFLAPEEVSRLLDRQGMPAVTPRSITSMEELASELALIRQRGYALDLEESMEGAFCVAAPVLDGQRGPVAAISLSGPAVRFNAISAPTAAPVLLEAAARIRSGLGYL